jgi:hypothetical protein
MAPAGPGASFAHHGNERDPLAEAVSALDGADVDAYAERRACDMLKSSRLISELRKERHSIAGRGARIMASGSRVPREEPAGWGVLFDGT